MITVLVVRGISVGKVHFFQSLAFDKLFVWIVLSLRSMLTYFHKNNCFLLSILKQQLQPLSLSFLFSFFETKITCFC